MHDETEIMCQSSTVRETSLLIVGGESDPNTQRIVDQAHLRGLDYFYWDTDLPHARQLAWDFESPVIDCGENAISPAAMFIRYNVFEGNPAINHAVFDAAESFALAWPQVQLLNRDTVGAVNNKSRNLRLAIECGFQIPKTTVLADMNPLSSMPEPQSKIIKPLAGGDHAQLVSELQNDSERLAELVPQFVQTKLDGENIRVFSIGGRLFAFHLETDHVDYRTDDSVKVNAMDVPSNIIDATRQLVQRTGFDYCALDFRCRDGFAEPVFLEVNSFPMFVAFDDAGENCLADAILEFLVDAT